MTCNRPRWTVIVNWDVVDEGPMEDLLGIEVEYLEACTKVKHIHPQVPLLSKFYFPSLEPVRAQTCR